MHRIRGSSDSGCRPNLSSTKYPAAESPNGVLVPDVGAVSQLNRIELPIIHRIPSFNRAEAAESTKPPIAGLFLTAGGSQEQDIHHSTFLANKSKKNKLDDAIPKMALAIADTFSIVAGSGHIEMTSVVSTDQTFILDHVISAPQITETVITELESVIVVPVISETSQDGDQGDSGLNMDQAAGENVPIHETWMQLIARAIFIAGLLTVIAVGRTALYKSASGVVFGHNKLAYYVTLAIIFLVGVSEIFTGVWISMSSLTYKRRLWIGGLVLFLSIWPIVCILSMSGFF